MKKIIEGKRNLLISIVLYCLSISIFLISQLSIVSGTFMSGSVFSYNYPLRVLLLMQNNMNVNYSLYMIWVSFKTRKSLDGILKMQEM